MTRKKSVKTPTLPTPKRRWACIYKAYFFEESRRHDYRLPHAITVIARDVESALGLLRAEFPGRVLSGLYRDRAYGFDDVLANECVLMEAPDSLLLEQQRLPCDVRESLIESRRKQWKGDEKEFKVPDEVRNLRQLYCTLERQGQSKDSAAMREILQILKTFEPIPEVL